MNSSVNGSWQGPNSQSFVGYFAQPPGVFASPANIAIAPPVGAQLPSTQVVYVQPANESSPPWLMWQAATGPSTGHKKPRNPGEVVAIATLIIDLSFLSLAALLYFAPAWGKHGGRSADLVHGTPEWHKAQTQKISDEYEKLVRKAAVAPLPSAAGLPAATGTVLHGVFGDPVRPGSGVRAVYLSPTLVSHKQVVSRADNGAQVCYDGKSGKIIFTTPRGFDENKLQHPPVGAQLEDTLVSAFHLEHANGGEARTHFWARAHSYDPSVVSAEHFRYYGIEKPDTLKSAYKRTWIRKEGGRFSFAEPLPFDQALSASDNTAYADRGRFMRGVGHAGRRLRDFGTGWNAAMRNPFNIGDTAGRIIMSSVVINVMIYALVASLGLYSLHKNDKLLPHNGSDQN